MNLSVLSVRPAATLAALTLAAGASLTGYVLAASSKADFALTVTPSTQTAAQGQTAGYTLTLTKQNGFASAVALSASNLPPGASVTFSPSTISSGTTSTAAILVGQTTPAATYSGITFTGTGGGQSHALTVSLSVTATQPPFTVSTSQGSARTLPGGTVSYPISTAGSGSLVLSASGLPASATATFTPASVTAGSGSTLQVATKNSTPSGNYTLTVRASNGSQTATTTVALSVSATGKNFTIGPASSALPPLAPGQSVPLDLNLTNPNNQALSVTNIAVSLQSVSKNSSAPSSAPCGPADYAVAQFSGAYPLTIAANASVTLSSLVADRSKWPTISMLDTSSNQDGCKGATLQYTFSGTGQG